MKNTILTRIIKKILLIEQGGFTLDPEPEEIEKKPKEETPKEEKPKEEKPKKEKPKEEKPFLSDSMKIWLYMAAYWGLLAAAGLVTRYILKKIGLLGWAGRGISKNARKIFGIPESASTALRGLNEADVDQLTTFALVEYRRKNITYSEYKKLIKAFKNPMLRSKINKQSFTAAYIKMQKGNMTMAELITFMPKAYQNSSSLKKALYAYERELNSAIPGRYKAWQDAAKLYATKNAQFRAEFEKLLGTKGSRSPLAPKDPPKSLYTQTNSSTLAAEKKAKEAAQLAKEKSQRAAWNKLSPKVDAIARECEFRPYKDKFQLYRDLTINDRALFADLCNVGPSELETLLFSFKNLKRPAVITKIKKLAAKNGWDFTKQEDAIESFMEHVLRFFP